MDTGDVLLSVIKEEMVPDDTLLLEHIKSYCELHLSEDQIFLRYLDKDDKPLDESFYWQLKDESEVPEGADKIAFGLRRIFQRLIIIFK